MVNYLIISVLVWATYCYALRCGFVSDDLEGITNYDGKLQSFEYGTISRWLRYHIAGGNFPSRLKAQANDGKLIEIPQGKIPFWHHFISITVFNVALLFLYAFISDKFSPTIALLTVCLFAVHPVCTQAVAWCSGLGYPLSLLWMCAALNLVPWIYAEPSVTRIVVGTLTFCLLQFLAIHAQFATMMLWTVLAFFGYWHFAVLGFIISLAMGFDIIRQTISFRAEEFKKQQMAKSTFLHPRKIVVALKTFIHYLRHSIWPHPMGLYHVYGFHYGADLERKDWKFLRGFLASVGLIGILLLHPPAEVRLAILWFAAFSVIFWNWITIQQFLTERYIFIPTIGTCLLISTLTQNHLWAYTFILGAYLIRTWTFLPTYDNELRFYQSNTWEFPSSEVAYGNLGVTYLRLGLVGSALDAWHQAIRVNPDYDVPYYNIFSNYRAQADMAINNGDYGGGMNAYRQALPYLEKTLQCKVCHFPDMWKKEHEEMLAMMKNPKAMLTAQKERLKKLDSDLQNRLAKEDNKAPIQQSIVNNQVQLQRLDAFMKATGLETA